VAASKRAADLLKEQVAASMRAADLLNDFLKEQVAASMRAADLLREQGEKAARSVADLLREQGEQVEAQRGRIAAAEALKKRSDDASDEDKRGAGGEVPL